MIPFAVKQAWFWLALTGLVQCWITLIYCGRKFGGLWARLTYCVFITLLEGMFCIGMVWHMDPSRMPRRFCIAQVISFSLASFALTGLCASFALACARAVFRPRSVNTGRAVLAWHPRYIPLLILFPVAACITHTYLLISLNSVQPSLSDDLHCDSTRPIWMRLLGYAGVPLIITIPFLVLSVFTAYRMYQVTRTHSSRGTYVIDDEEDDFGHPDTYPYSNDGLKKRSTISLSAFLPYPNKSWFKKSKIVSPLSKEVFDDESTGYPLHKHPFPVVDPLTGSPYSPSLGREDVVSFTMSTTSLRVAHTESHQSNYSPVRAKSSTPDSVVSSTIPMFMTYPAIRPGLQPAKAQDIALASGSSIRLYSLDEASDTAIGLVITTADTPSPRISMHATVGLAVTTDELERMVTPTPPLLAQSPTKNEDNRTVSPMSSITHAAQHSPQIHNSDPPQSASDAPMALRERTTLSESVPYPPQLENLDRSFPSTSSSTDHPPLPPRHQRRSSFVSSGTLYSPANIHSDKEDWNVLPTPPIASYFRSPMTHNIQSEDATHGMGTTHLAGSQSKDDVKNLEWEDEEYEHDLPTRIHRRDPRERLGVYNPTPPMGPTAATLERRRQALRMEMQTEGGPKLGWAIPRMVLFQIAFFAVQLLACLSCILDLAHNTITPFGTQHVALILAAWGPLFIFARVPNVLGFLKRPR